MRSELKERFARLGQARDVARVRSGFPAVVVLKPQASLTAVRTIDVATALMRHGVKALAAKRTVEAMVEMGEARIDVPLASDELAESLARAGVAAWRLASDAVDVRAVREKLGLSQDQFAKKFGLNLRTLQNWEQHRTSDPAANNYLRVIASNPEIAAKAQLEKL